MRTEIREKRMSVAFINIYLAEHWESDTIVTLCECLDGFVRLGLLGCKLVARKCKNFETTFVVPVV